MVRAALGGCGLPERVLFLEVSSGRVSGGGEGGLVILLLGGRAVGGGESSTTLKMIVGCVGAECGSGGSGLGGLLLELAGALDFVTWGPVSGAVLCWFPVREGRSCVAVLEEVSVAVRWTASM